MLYAAPVGICSTFNYRGKAYYALKQILEDILNELVTSALETIHTEDSVQHIKMHPGNRVLFFSERSCQRALSERPFPL